MKYKGSNVSFPFNSQNLLLDVPEMKGRKWYSLKKDLQPFNTRTSN